jgi:hypothetical protein
MTVLVALLPELAGVTAGVAGISSLAAALVVIAATVARAFQRITLEMLALVGAVGLGAQAVLVD